ncbi:hypothetical protein BU15DRAFT_66656 [Melanogaster broomeanus]|nr:hypothetical protein BU15DRAFT_66656 [Melanogaster broomeanus]
MRRPHTSTSQAQLHVTGTPVTYGHMAHRVSTTPKRRRYYRWRGYLRKRKGPYVEGDQVEASLWRLMFHLLCFCNLDGPYVYVDDDNSARNAYRRALEGRCHFGQSWVYALLNFSPKWHQQCGIAGPDTPLSPCFPPTVSTGTVGLGFRIFVDFMFTQSLSRLALVALWTVVARDSTCNGNAPLSWFFRGNYYFVAHFDTDGASDRYLGNNTIV